MTDRITRRTRTRKLVQPGTDLRKLGIESIIKDMTIMLKRGKVQVAHRAYLARMLRKLNIDTVASNYKEDIIREICEKMKRTAINRETAGLLPRGIQGVVLSDIVDDIEQTLIGAMFETWDDYDFINEDDV